MNPFLYELQQDLYRLGATKDNAEGVNGADAVDFLARLTERVQAEIADDEASDRAKACARPDGTEGGAASVRIELDEGAITAYHGTDNVALARLDKAPPGTWDRLWTALEQLGLERTTPTGPSPDDTNKCDDCGAQAGDDGMSCPDGAYICRACFDAGRH